MTSFWFNDTETQAIVQQLVENSNDGKPLNEFLETVISEFEGSTFRKDMDVGNAYYSNNNDINNAKRTIIGKDSNNNPTLLESTVLANNKLAHNFMRKLTRQKIGYILSKPFSFAAVKENDARAQKMFSMVGAYFDFEFFKRVKNVGRDSIVKQLGWLMVYYDEQGTLKFKRCEPEEIIPFWKDAEHTLLDAVVRKYKVEVYKGANKKIVRYVDFYSRDGISHFVYDEDGKLIRDPNNEEVSPYFVAKRKKEDGSEIEVGVNWSRLPFIPFKYDPDEKGLIHRIKSLIDDYDKKTSGISNAIDDFPNSMLLVKGYDGASKEEFVHNKNQFRTVFVQEGGDASTLEQKLNVTDVDVHIQRLREDIYEFGQGVNTADKDIRDTSGVALRFMYADLDVDCMDWSGEIEWSLMLLVWFIQQDILVKTNEDFSDVEYRIIFNNDIIINESETIQNCTMSNGIISNKTIANNHPWVLDAESEVKQLMQEQGEVLDLEAEYEKDIARATKSTTTPENQRQ